MDRVRKLMGFTSSSSGGSTVTSSSSQLSGSTTMATTASHTMNRSASRYGGSSSSNHDQQQFPASSRYGNNHQQQRHDRRHHDFPEDFEQNNQFAGVNLGSGKMSISKSGRWKKKERRRLSLWDEESGTATAADGPASLPGGDHRGSHAHGAASGTSSHGIVFRELGKSKRVRAPQPPMPSAAPRTSYPSQQMSRGDVVRSTMLNRQQAPPPPRPPLASNRVTASSFDAYDGRQQQLTPSSSSSSRRNVANQPSGRDTNNKADDASASADGEEDGIDDATISQLIEDFNAAIRMHEDDDDDHDDDDAAACQDASSATGIDGKGNKTATMVTSGPVGISSSKVSYSTSLSLSTSTRATSSLASKPQVIPRQPRLHRQQY